MKFTAIFAAIMSFALISADCSAQPFGRQRGNKGANPSGERQAQGQRGQRSERGAQGRGRDGAEQRNPAELAARMMKEFDKDGDNKLSTAELVALMTSMRDRRGAGLGAGNAGADGAGRRMGKGQRPEGAGKGGSKVGGKGQQGKGAGQSDAPGGQKPKRPDSDLS